MQPDSLSLTQRQRAVLDFIQSFVKQKGYPPSRREIEDAMGLSSASTSRCLQELDQHGSIRVDPNRPRGIRLPGPLEPAPSLRVPILGTISAGIPVMVPVSDFPFFQSNQVVEVSHSLLPPRLDTSRLFALQVRGHGLIGLSILDGDMAIFESLPRYKRSSPRTIRDGEIVVVRFPRLDQAALVRFHRQKDGYRLEPANPILEPLYVKKAGLEVEGRLVAVIRSFRQ
jgi:repressor LexA